MGGVDGDLYKYFKFLMLKGFMAARKHMDKFVQLVEIISTGVFLSFYYNSSMHGLIYFFYHAIRFTASMLWPCPNHNKRIETTIPHEPHRGAVGDSCEWDD